MWIPFDSAVLLLALEIVEHTTGIIPIDYLRTAQSFSF